MARSYVDDVFDEKERLLQEILSVRNPTPASDRDLIVLLIREVLRLHRDLFELHKNK